MTTTTNAEAAAILAQATAPFAGMPDALWTALGVVGAAALAALAAIIGHLVGSRNKAKVDAGQLALQLATTQGEEIGRLSGRVTSLEIDRNAYRSWSHVLWDHIHDENVPRTPAPIWPTTLAR